MNPLFAQPSSQSPLRAAGLAFALGLAVTGLFATLLPGTFQTAPGWSLVLMGLSLSTLMALIAWKLVSAKAKALQHAEALARSMRVTLDRYLSHVENTPMGIIEWDESLRIRAWNPAAERIFGYAASEVLGRLGDGFLAAEGARPVAAEAPFQTLLPGGGGTRLTRENLRKDGSPIICNWYNAPLRNASGETVGVTTLVEDITERRRNEEALRLSQKLESLGVLAGGVAHDFNNLLTAIQGHTELAIAQVTPENPLYDNLRRIEATTHRAADLSRQMLAYSGRAKFASKPLDLNALLRDMGELLKVSVPKKVRIYLDLDKELPAVQGDQAQLQQVVLNLVTNAAEAIGEAAGQVHLSSHRKRLGVEDIEALTLHDDMIPGEFVGLEVRDSGSGIPAGMITKIFEPFFTTKFSGRGLGLSATVGILRNHGGGIRVSSEEGVGTCFQIYLPASMVPLELAPDMPRASAGAEAGTVLIVDDEGIVRDLAVMALQPLGYEVLTAQDGQEAVEIYERHPGQIHVVLMDMTMPRMDGLEAFQRIRALDANARVILSSGYSEQEAIHAARELNPEGFLQKPYRIQELLQRVHDAVVRGEP